MLRIRTRFVTQLAVTAVAALASGCMCCGSVAVGELTSETRTVELQGAQSVEAELDLGIGKFTIRSGSEPLMTGEFTYNVPEWRPEIDYAVDGGIGKLRVAQPSTSKSVRGKTKNEWDISFGGGIPIALKVDVGVGNADLELGDIMLSSLSVDQGVGNATIDLTGEWQSDVHITIDGGVGNTTLILPESVGIRVDTDTGIGRTSVTGLEKRGRVYTNDAYGEAGANLDIKVNAGVGNVTIKVSGTGMASI